MHTPQCSSHVRHTSNKPPAWHALAGRRKGLLNSFDSHDPSRPWANELRRSAGWRSGAPEFGGTCGSARCHPLRRPLEAAAVAALWPGRLRSRRPSALQSRRRLRGSLRLPPAAEARLASALQRTTYTTGNRGRLQQWPSTAVAVYSSGRLPLRPHPTVQHRRETCP